MYGIATASAYFFTVCACLWSCARLADDLVMFIGPEILASTSSTNRSASRVERRLQNLAESPEPMPVRPPVRAMTPPRLSAAQLAIAMDRSEAARLARSLPLSSLPLETVPAIAVAASGPDEEVTVITLEAKPLIGSRPRLHHSSSRHLAMARSSSKRKVAPGTIVVLRSTDDSPRAKKRALAAAIASARVPNNEPAPQLNATPGALMFASFIRRES